MRKMELINGMKLRQKKMCTLKTEPRAIDNRETESCHVVATDKMDYGKSGDLEQCD